MDRWSLRWILACVAIDMAAYSLNPKDVEFLFCMPNSAAWILLFGGCRGPGKFMGNRRTQHVAHHGHERQVTAGMKTNTAEMGEVKSDDLFTAGVITCPRCVASIGLE